MTNVQEALKAAEKLIVKAIMFESEAEQYLSESNYELNGCLGDSAADISVNGKAVLAKVRAALAEIERKGWVSVPIEPTEEMREAAIREQEYRRKLSLSEYGDVPAIEIYKAMIQAAPKE